MSYCFGRVVGCVLLLVCLSFAGNSQLCSGSLGDPAVNITFGYGSNPGLPLPAATTNYKYAYDACPVNGFYSIVSSGVECNYGWHVLQSDHTGNPNGYFMLVDASFEPGDFYLDTVTSLCANTTYEFAAWMLNMKKITQGIRPDIDFSVETTNGVVLQKYNTGSIPVENEIKWRQYGFYFTTPPNISAVVLRMTNRAPGGGGNDLALDDITFRPCGPIINAGIANHSDTLDVCEGDSSSFTFTGDAAAAYLNPVYQWQVSTNVGTSWQDVAGANAATYVRIPTGVGTYLYRLAVSERNALTNIKCRTASHNLLVQVHASPIVNAGANRTIFAGDTLHLNATIQGERLTIVWSPAAGLSNAHIQSPVASPTANTTYTLFGQSIYGCKQQDVVDIKVVEGIFVPTAFTPNNDGLNDKWRIPFLDPILNATVYVFNRYGQIMYKTKGTTVEWDGSFRGLPQTSGNYIYLIKFTNGKKERKGTFMLLR
ncbi:MAG: gliding motility-associated C-terminal domain-containing protein [Chitinophagaceae bacterium]|nr:gliding motility-associated C-terminal domain-containing protein [Chitinophagaceae bacterium]